MSTSPLLPEETKVHDLLSSLYGADIQIAMTETRVAMDDICVLATYCSDDGKVARTISCDYAYANRAGAALTMFPAGGADDAIKAKEIPENYLDNLKEVLNISVNLFPETPDSRLVLGEIFASKDEIEEKQTEAVSDSMVSFEVNFPRYGNGIISLSISQ